MWKGFVERGRPQMTIRRMRVACSIPKATNIHSQVVLYLLLFPLQQRLHESAPLLRYTYSACIVIFPQLFGKEDSEYKGHTILKSYLLYNWINQHVVDTYVINNIYLTTI